MPENIIGAKLVSQKSANITRLDRHRRVNNIDTEETLTQHVTEAAATLTQHVTEATSTLTQHVTAATATLTQHVTATTATLTQYVDDVDKKVNARIDDVEKDVNALREVSQVNSGLRAVSFYAVTGAVYAFYLFALMEFFKSDEPKSMETIALFFAFAVTPLVILKQSDSDAMSIISTAVTFFQKARQLAKDNNNQEDVQRRRPGPTG